ncbi:hypothetical protein C8J57DRAFT_1218742 [Mycena rebaudengoi]|nr:hypothetical protein C8J57DRAFT_1218742 [Mycena rebaudengoi]
MATELQRPQGGFGVALDRLEDTFWASFTGTWDVQVRDRFVQVAIVGGCMQRSNLPQAKDQELYLPASTPESLQLVELRNVFETWKGSRECFCSARTQSSMDWVLCVLPYTIWDMSEKDNYLHAWLEDLPEKMGSPTHYAKYLICMNALLGVALA